MTSAAEPIDLATESDLTLGPLTLRPSLRTIEAGGRSDILEPRVMQVLVALARADGAVVSRDMLIARCWGGRVVGDDAINRAIGKIRQVAALGGAPAFAVETVPRVGYRLRAIAPAAEPLPLETASTADAVIATPAPAALRPPNPLPAGPSTAGRRSWLIGAAVGAVGLIVLIAALLYGQQAVGPAPAPAVWAVASSEQFIASSLREREPAIAHDGSMIAYAAGKDFLHLQIYLKRTAGGDPLPLTHDAYENVWPSWSPDDTQIAFAQIREDGNCHLMIVAVPVGSPREVARCKAERAAKVVWSADPNIIFFEDYLGKGHRKQVWQLDLATGATKPVTADSYDLFWYAVSVDGQWLAYGATLDNSQSGQLVLRNLRNQSERTLSPSIDFDTFTFSQDGQSLFVSRTSNSDYGLWSIALPDGHETRFFTSPVALNAIAAGPNGLLAAEVGRPELDLVRAKPGGETATVFAERIGNVAPDVASDGTIAWFHVAGSYAGIYVQRGADKPHELLKLASKQLDLGVPVWSPDATKLAILTSENDIQEIRVVSADGALLNRFAFPDVTLSRPAWRAGGDRLVVAARGQGNSALWELALVDGARTKLSDTGDWIDLKSHGDDIYGTRAHETGVWLVADPPKHVSLRPGDANPFAWAIRGDAVAYVDLLPDGPKIMQQAMGGGAPQKLLDVPDIWPASWYGFTVEATTGDFLYARDNGDSDVELFRLVKK